MKKLRKLKSAVAAVFKPKKLASLAIALTTVFAMLPTANISASAYSYTGLDEPLEPELLAGLFVLPDEPLLLLV